MTQAPTTEAPMTHATVRLSPTTKGEDSHGPDRSIFRIQIRSGIWGVKLDGQFYGDFRGLSFALESVR